MRDQSDNGSLKSRSVLGTGIVNCCTFTILGIILALAMENEVTGTFLGRLGTYEGYYFFRGLEAVSHDLSKLSGHRKCWRSWISFEDEKAVAAERRIVALHHTMSELREILGPPDAILPPSQNSRNREVKRGDETWLYDIGYSVSLGVSISQGKAANVDLWYSTH
jgi:hypothetical protein